EITYFRNEFDPEYFKKEVLPKIETRYLRYLRNTVFALYDYKFSNKEFVDFFSQFNWYAYDESMTIDKINEKMPQKFVNLVTYIKEEEDRRK
ncbi:MAG: YARHG domain-containing protein, partial [Treponema sp.]|nr:YARHG domain-containing protein [Treponema sp.]